jgi:hypothetical protein
MSWIRAWLWRNRWLLGLGLVAAMVRWFAGDAERVERYYASGIFPRLSGWLGHLLGRLPFSLGDLLYLVAGVGLLVALWRLWSEQAPWRGRVLRGLRAALSWGLGVNIAFNLSWGLNYDRTPLDRRLGLVPQTSDTVLLQGLTDALLQRVNAFSSAGQRKPVSATSLGEMAREGYRLAGRTHPALHPPVASFKSSLYGSLGNYIGYSGYYNPFTGEGQLNATIPAFLHPFVTCHELAHQIGIARENEANLAGFLAARAVHDSAFRYSAYLDMFLYAVGNLHAFDSAAAQTRLQALSPAAKADIRELQAFQERYRTPVDQASDWLYDRFLRLNGQAEGIRSYSSVVVWLLALYRRDGDI